MAQLEKLASDARRIQEKAERAKDYRSALAGVRELTRLVELTVKLSSDSLSRERALAIFSALCHSVNKNVSDNACLARILEEFKATMSRENIPVRPQLTAGERN
jgi:hypothetical protein